MKTFTERIKEKPSLGWGLFLGTIVIVFLLGLLASSIIERRAEASIAYKPTVEYGQFESRNEVWGQNYPREYQTYMKTKDTTFKSEFNGNGKVDVLEANPRMVVLWAGYAFSKEYTQPRGHAYAVQDVQNSLRTGAPMTSHDGPQPGTCWTCKSPDVPRMMNKMGIAEFYKTKWSALGPEIVNPIGCADCHDAKTMNLKITRPALIEAFERQGKDIKQASYQEMRSLVCAQCHVEYYFKGDGKYLTFPWDKGVSVDSIEAYYDKAEFKDWVHGLSRTPMLKAQHPDFEIASMGIHAQRGVSCADCHMPYRSEGGQKFTNHHIMSPLANISQSCQVCHRQSEETLRNNVYDRQRKVKELRDKLEDALVAAHIEAKAAWDAGATEAEMKNVLQMIRKAQWRWDFAVAGHGNSFHAPLEVARIMGNGITFALNARIELSNVLQAHHVAMPVKLPDISTKEKAQKYIGLDMAKLKAEKKVFSEKVLPIWNKKAKSI